MGANFNLAHFLLQVAVIVLFTRLVGRAFRLLGQPHVTGEMVAGILLGPSILGLIAPGIAGALFPEGSLDYLNALSQIGLVFFMFLVGTELDAGLLRDNLRTALGIGAASVVVPFALGSVLALALYERHAPAGVSLAAFTLFVGAALSVTAFPVLARILEERGIATSRLGVLSLACAAMNDVTAWCIVAVVIAFVRSASSRLSLAITVLGAALFVAVMLGVVRPLLERLEARARAQGDASIGLLAAAMSIALLAAWATEMIGIHAVFGAFIAGAVMPRGGSMARDLRTRFEAPTLAILLPIMFALTGIRTRIDFGAGWAWWSDCLLVVSVAIASKIGGVALAARLNGIAWREALSLGALMNTRGLMELVVLTIGLEIGVITDSLFAVMVLMTVVTTGATAPLLKVLWPESREPGRADVEVEQAS